MTAGQTLRWARRKKGLTQRAVALAAGVPQPSVARIESGKVTPRADTLESLLAVCGYSMQPAPLLGEGIDRTAIRERLASSPLERLRLATSAAAGLTELREAASR
jgi:transcriptional regulator with XRE-family HTH domain